MRSKRISPRSFALVATFLLSLLLPGLHAAAQQETVLHSFGRAMDGNYPLAGLVADAAGNLYATTSGGGAGGYISSGGTVYEMSLGSDGNWTENVIHSFDNYGTDAVGPWAGLVSDTAGNFYGTTKGGGFGGYGTVFKLTRAADGTWTEILLHSFNGNDGAAPLGTLLFDRAGNLYGTTASGGYYGDFGTAFELIPNADGSWTETLLHSFSQNGEEGWGPSAGLIFDASGNLYGTTAAGGTNFGEGGAVFELMPRNGKGWAVKVLHSFGAIGDGSGPNASLIFDAAGNLYGTSTYGGVYKCSLDYHCGTVFELSPKSDGAWAEQVLHSFGSPTDGTIPEDALIFDSAGNLYGTTYWGSYSNASYGTVFELTRATGGVWTEKILHNFYDNGKDGLNPYGGLVRDAAGNLYGTTLAGGASGLGTVFEVTP